MRSGQLKDEHSHALSFAAIGADDSAAITGEAARGSPFAASTVPALSPIVAFAPAPGGLLPAVAPPPTFLQVALPLPVVAAPGGTVPLSTILTTDFGPAEAGPYPEFWIGYSGAATLTQENFSYWNLSSESVA